MHGTLGIDEAVGTRLCQAQEMYHDLFAAKEQNSCLDMCVYVVNDAWIWFQVVQAILSFSRNRKLELTSSVAPAPSLSRHFAELVCCFKTINHFIHHSDGWHCIANQRFVAFEKHTGIYYMQADRSPSEWSWWSMGSKWKGRALRWQNPFF